MACNEIVYDPYVTNTRIVNSYASQVYSPILNTLYPPTIVYAPRIYSPGAADIYVRPTNQIVRNYYVPQAYSAVLTAYPRAVVPRNSSAFVESELYLRNLRTVYGRPVSQANVDTLLTYLYFNPRTSRVQLAALMAQLEGNSAA